MANNKVVYGNTTIMDITDTTAEASDVAAGEVFYGRDGVRSVGTGNYMDKVSNPTADDILVTDANGQAQDSGTTIADIDNLFVAFANITTYSELHAAIGAHKYIVVDDAPTGGAMIDDDRILITIFTNSQKVTYAISTTNEWTVVSRRPYVGQATDSNSGTIKTDSSNGISLDADGKLQITGMMDLVSSPTADDILITNASGQATDSGVGINDVAMAADLPTQATDSTLGLVKLNPNESVEVNANGQLTVGGRLGQFPGGGVFYPTTIEPTTVGGSTFMMTDGAKYLSLGPRTFGIMAGVSLTCKSAAAGTTQYRLSNTQGNRFTCFANKGGRIAIDQTDAQTNGTALITDISFANGDPISAYFGPTESSNDIIITVDRTVNPSAATTKLRMYGTSTSSDVIIVGQGNGASGGKAISLGQACHAGGNQCIAFGNSSLSLANNSVALGHTQLVNKQFCFCAGQGHDFTNGGNGAAAVGIASEIVSDTAFAVGNGVFNSNGNITRSNALEVKTDGSIVLKSPNGTKYKIAVDDSGNLTATAV